MNSPTEFERIIEEVVTLNDRKRSDYGSTFDPLANLRAGEEFGVPAWVLAQIRVMEKGRRVRAFINGSTLMNEGVEDSLLDQIVYAIHALTLFREDHVIGSSQNEDLNKEEE